MKLSIGNPNDFIPEMKLRLEQSTENTIRLVASDGKLEKCLILFKVRNGNLVASRIGAADLIGQPLHRLPIEDA